MVSMRICKILLLTVHKKLTIFKDTENGRDSLDFKVVLKKIMAQYKSPLSYKAGHITTYLSLSCLCSNYVVIDVFNYSEDIVVCTITGLSRYPDDPLIPQISTFARLDCSLEETLLWCDIRGLKRTTRFRLKWIKYWLLFKQALHVDMIEAFKWLWKA